MKNWGSNIWIFLHTFSVKIKNELFNENKLMILSFIELIFTNLPCTICKKDSLLYFNQKKETINSKNDLILFIFDFHNNVNLKLDKKKFDFSIIERYYLCDVNIIFKLIKGVFIQNEIYDFLENNKYLFNYK